MASQKNALATNIYLEIDGSECAPKVKAEILEVTVDQNVHLSGMFSIRLNDVGLKILDEGPFDIAKTVKISADNVDGKKTVLIEGEITALEPEFGEGMLAELVVRGFDQSHRLLREVKSKSFLNQKDSDLANTIAQGAGLSANVDATSTVYDYIAQYNMTDLQFLMHRAWRIGYECFVQDNKLNFRKPLTGSGEAKLLWGQDLLEFHPRMTTMEQVDEVVVKGWDVAKKEAIVGRASGSDGNLYPEIKESKNGSGWAKEFGSSKMIILDEPVVSQSEADILAQARVDELAGSFVVAEGIAFRRPDICAGKIIGIEGIGKRFSGSYLVTQAVHSYSAAGLETHFAVRGSRLGMISEFASQAAHRHSQIPGAVIGIVTNNEDPENWGRIKVAFPWVNEEIESDWLRVMGIGAGENRGMCHIPQVDDEVVVTFDQGEFGRGFVLGGVWNGTTPLPDGVEGSEIADIRIWKSKNGHQILICDNADDKVELLTAAGHTILLDDANKLLQVKTSGGQELTFDDNGNTIDLKGNGELTVDAGSTITIKAGADVSIEASASLNLKATAGISIDAGGGTVDIKGSMINLN
ncbi:MAG: VgrG-related protein [Chloroflexota bacterium]